MKVILGYFSVVVVFLEGGGGCVWIVSCSVFCEIISRVYFAGTSEEIFSSQINVSKERKGAKYCNACCQ